jgi:hypothetical protein
MIMARPCKCPDDAQLDVGTYGDRYLRLCNCCRETWREDPPEIDPWLLPGHVCTCGEGHETD